MTLPRKIEITLPDALPKDLENTLYSFCSQILAALKVREGVNTAHLYDKAVTRRDLENLGIDTTDLGDR